MAFERRRVGWLLPWVSLLVAACAAKTPPVAAPEEKLEVKAEPPPPTVAEVQPAEVSPAPEEMPAPEEKPAIEPAAPAPEPEKSSKPVEAKPVRKKAAPAPAEKKEPYSLVAVAKPDAKTERLWRSKCASCHGMDGKAATEQGKKMRVSDVTLPAWQTSRSDDRLKKAIRDGVKSESAGVKQEMDPYEEELTAAQIDATVQYVRWLGAPR